MRRHVTLPIFVPHAGCPHACSFCNQRHISGALEPPSPQQVTETVEKALRAGEPGEGAEIAFFGGSFTAIPSGYRRALLEAVQPFLGERGFSGIRISTRPDAISPEILEEMAAYRVKVMELGVQSMEDRVLEYNGRGHTARQTEEASALIRSGGFSLGHQMMVGLPGDTGAGALETARRIIDMAPDMVRIYPAVVLRGTRMEELWRSGAWQPLAVEEVEETGARLLDLFHRAGIPVIRFGLQDDGPLRESMVAGPHHPALRELCESRRLLDQVREQLEEREIRGGSIRLRVHPRSVSQMTGQRRKNIRLLADRGFDAAVVPDAAMPPHRVAVEPD